MKDTKPINFLIAILAVGFLLTTYLVYAERPTLPTVNTFPVQINFGFMSIATPTWEINDSAPLTINDILPSGAMGFELRAASGAVVIAHPDNIATGTDRVGRLVPSGGTYSWSGLAGTFRGVVVSNVGSATVTFDAVWGDWQE